MTNTEILNIIADIFNQKPILKGIDGDQDFFDLGASSLTIVDIQLQVESALSKTVETSVLMADPTINGWVSAYAGN